MTFSPKKCKWFSGRGTIGIVRAENEAGEVAYYLGLADGLNEQIDINLIVSFGARFPSDAGDLLFGVGAPAVAERPKSTKRVSTMARKRPATKKPAARPVSKPVKKSVKKAKE